MVLYCVVRTQSSTIIRKLTMYEDSQRFSDDERDDEGNTVRANPRQTQFVSRETDTKMFEPSFTAAADVVTPETKGQIPPDSSYYGESKSQTEFSKHEANRRFLTDVTSQWTES